MRSSIVLAGLALFTVAGCASPESRVRASLINIGFPSDTASCMADNVASRLTSQQIRDLSRLSGLSERRIERMTIGDFTELLTRSGNLDMVAIFARAGVGCAIIG